MLLQWRQAFLSSNARQAWYKETQVSLGMDHEDNPSKRYAITEELIAAPSFTQNPS